MAAAMIASASAGYTFQDWECTSLDSGGGDVNLNQWSFYAVTPYGQPVCDNCAESSGTYNQIISQGSTADFCSQTSTYSDIALDSTILVQSSNGGSYTCGPADASAGTLDFQHCTQGFSVSCVVSQAYNCPTGLCT